MGGLFHRGQDMAAAGKILVAQGSKGQKIFSNGTTLRVYRLFNDGPGVLSVVAYVAGKGSLVDIELGQSIDIVADEIIATPPVSGKPTTGSYEVIF
jgi:hypothetical protein